jgi:hypothetical protein
VRLFLAIEPGEDCRRSLAVAMERVQAAAASGVPLGKSQTVACDCWRFFGEVGEKRLHEILTGRREVAFATLTVLREPSRDPRVPELARPRVVWLGRCTTPIT